MATTQIKSIEAKTYQGKVTGHSVTLMDGVTGYLDDKSSDQDLKNGEVVDYLLTVKQNKQGKDYNLLTIKRTLAGGQAQPPTQQARTETRVINPPKTTERQGGMTKEDWKIRATIDAYGFMVEAVSNDKLDWPQIEEKQRQARDILWRDIDEVFSTR